jgi:2'-5' RNA ligase
MNDPFARVWNAFASAEVTADGRHDTPYWRSHEGPFAACVIRVNPQSLQPELNALRHDLARIGGVRIHPEHFLHIMLQELGFLAADPRHPDEINTSRLEEFAHAAASAVANVPPIIVELGGANSFLDAVFLEVHPGQPLSLIHERLYDLAAAPHVPDFAYLPHCTIAHYAGAVPVTDALNVLSSWRDAICGELHLAEIEIVTLDPTIPYPELESYAVIPLGP